MLKSRRCPICNNRSEAKLETYKSGKFYAGTKKEIIVEGVEVYHCLNSDCSHTWLPLDQERKIDQYVSRNKRFDLTKDQIKTVRECLPFHSKFQVADFMCLNEKAFTKWELGYSEPNRAYDLLIRLVAHSKDNFDFVKHLHSSSFAFDPADYEFVCSKKNMNWNFRLAKSGSFQNLTTIGFRSAGSLQHSVPSLWSPQQNEIFVQMDEKKYTKISGDEEVA